MSARLTFCLTILLTAGASEAMGGFLLAPSVRVGSFSARPLDNEPTPNYYTTGLGVSVGYSAGQRFDLAGYFHYLPGNLHTFSPGEEDAVFIAYGGEVAFRFSDAIYVGLRGGTAKYQLYQASRVEDDELTGTYEGPAGGFSLGAIQKLGKRNFLQTTLDVMHTIGEDVDGEVEGKRRFDTLTLSVAYVFNAYSSSMMDNSIFKSFLDSMSFF